tara:strand:- start:8090 stop:8293 length:204 start_codon:yes stop_codon:yes gene_type:complete
MKQEHLITGLVVFGVLVYILNAKKSTLDSAVVNLNSKDTLSFDGIDNTMADMSTKNVFKSQARFNLR